MNKRLCKCGKIATWLYMPGDDDWGCCDNCVPRGCSCNEEPIDGNWDNINENNWIEKLDDKGRKFPCCEWWYQKEGWNLNE